MISPFIEFVLADNLSPLPGLKILVLYPVCPRGTFAFGNSRFCIWKKYTKPAHEHHCKSPRPFWQTCICVT